MNRDIRSFPLCGFLFVGFSPFCRQQICCCFSRFLRDSQKTEAPVVYRTSHKWDRLTYVPKNCVWTNVLRLKTPYKASELSKVFLTFCNSTCNIILIVFEKVFHWRLFNECFYKNLRFCFWTAILKKITMMLIFFLTKWNQQTTFTNKARGG